MTWRTWLARRRELVGINRRNVALVYAENERRFYPIADDKLLCKQHLERGGVPTPETVAVCEGLYDIPRVLALLVASEQFVLKPAHGSGGAGITVLGERTGEGEWRRAGGGRTTLSDLHRQLAEIIYGRYSGELTDRAFVEKRIVPHEAFQALWSDGLCDVRVITWRRHPVMAMVRVPTAQSGGRANLHQGGLGLAVDLREGRTVRAFHRGRSITHHPESGAALLGQEMPAWPAVLSAARAAAAAVPLGYLGVDVVVDRVLGPLVLEINARPGLEIQNVHGRGLAAAIAEVAAS